MFYAMFYVMPYAVMSHSVMPYATLFGDIAGR
jgi:hypothetical protein